MASKNIDERWTPAELDRFLRLGIEPDHATRHRESVTARAHKETSEAVFQARVIKLLEQAGYASELIYHTQDSRRSNPGFCDIVAIRPSDHHRKWIECKTEKGQPSAEQFFWLMELQLGGEDASLLRPSDIQSLIVELDKGHGK